MCMFYIALYALMHSYSQLSLSSIWSICMYSTWTVAGLGIGVAIVGYILSVASCPSLHNNIQPFGLYMFAA